jgi:hypothetical protein
VGTIDRVALSDVSYQNGVPASFTLDMSNLKIDPRFVPNAPPNSILLSMGYTQSVFNASVSYRVDEATKQTISNGKIVLDQGGTLSTSAVLDDVQPGAPQAVKIGSLLIQYDDNSLATRWLNYVAQQTHGTVDSVRRSYIAWLEAQKPNFAGDLPLANAIGALQSFIANPHQLILALKPPQPVGIADFDRAHPETFTSKLGLTVTAQ